MNIDRGYERLCFKDWDRGSFEGPCNCEKALVLRDSYFVRGSFQFIVCSILWHLPYSRTVSHH